MTFEPLLAILFPGRDNTGPNIQETMVAPSGDAADPQRDNGEARHEKR